MSSTGGGNAATATGGAMGAGGGADASTGSADASRAGSGSGAGSGSETGAGAGSGSGSKTSRPSTGSLMEEGAAPQGTRVPWDLVKFYLTVTVRVMVRAHVTTLAAESELGLGASRSDCTRDSEYGHRGTCPGPTAATMLTLQLTQALQPVDQPAAH